MSSEQTFGDYLRAARIARDFSLRGLADSLSIAPSYLSDIENDRRVPADEVMRRLADALHKDYDELLSLAGRLDDETERLLKRQPEAVRLFRRITALKLSSEELRELTDKLPDQKEREG